MPRPSKPRSALYRSVTGRAPGSRLCWTCLLQCSPEASQPIRFPATPFVRAAFRRFFWRSIQVLFLTLTNWPKLLKVSSIRCVKQRLSIPASLSAIQASRLCSCARRTCGSASRSIQRFGNASTPQIKKRTGSRIVSAACPLCFAEGGLEVEAYLRSHGSRRDIVRAAEG